MAVAAEPISLAPQAPWRSAAGFAAAVNCLVWSFGAALFVTSLHPDTLQIVFWGRNPQLGYPKHPPLASWILNALVHPHAAPLLTVLLIGAACVAFTAAFIWGAARLFAPPAVAAVATSFYLLSPTAGVFAIQVNHNSLLIPFWAGALYFALRYFERRKTVDALLLGLFAGLGAITKYELLFLLVALAALCVAIPQYRPALRRGASWLSALVFLTICAPHLYWLSSHASQSLDYALTSRPMQGASDVLASLNNLFVGELVLALGPALGYLLLLATGLRPRIDRSRLRLSAIIALGPSLALVIASLAFDQTIRQGWTIPFIPGTVLGAALCLKVERASAPRRWLTAMSAQSFLQLALFFVFLALRARFGHPVGAYDLDSRGMAKQTQAFWAARNAGPLKCLIIDKSFLSSAPILWLPDRPKVVQLDKQAWSGPRRLAACLAHGAVLIAQAPGKPPSQLPLCSGEQALRAISPLSGGVSGFDLVLAYAPPRGDLSECGAPKKPFRIDTPPG